MPNARKPAAKAAPAEAALPLQTESENQKNINRHRERWAALGQDARTIGALFAGIDEVDLDMFQACRLIRRNDHGSSTPVEEFMRQLIQAYSRRDAEGRGLNVEEIESFFDTLRNDYDHAVADAQFIASRYPVSKAAKEENFHA